MADPKQKILHQLKGRHIQERQNLLSALYQHDCYDDRETQSVQHCIDLVSSTDQCFEREYFTPGHITASGFLFNRSRSKLLLTHHKKLNRWLQLGGHSDGCPDPIEVALMEAHEESGLSKDMIFVLSDTPFRVDRHIFPARPQNNVPEHYHHDIQYLLIADTDHDFNLSAESNKLKWFTPDEALKVIEDGALINSLKKLKDNWDWFKELTVVSKSNC